MTAIWETEDYQQFLARIREQPADDVVRLVFADWLEERGHGERAEFVRVLCHAAKCSPCRSCSQWSRRDCHDPDCVFGLHDRALTILLDCNFTPTKGLCQYIGSGRSRDSDGVFWERGFVCCVRGPLASLHVGECGAACPETGNRCDGGRTIAPNPAFTRECKACRGTGRTPGILAELIRREPIGCDGIEVTDREPYPTPSGYWRWFEEPPDGRAEPRPSHSVPKWLFDAMYPRWPPPRRGESPHFPTAGSARLALSRALYSIHAPQSEVSR